MPEITSRNPTRATVLGDDEEKLLCDLIEKTGLQAPELLRRTCRHSLPLFCSGAVDILTLEPSKLDGRAKRK